MMETNNEISTTQQKLKTYFDNNLVVIKDAIMFKLLFKLRSIDQLEYNKAKKYGNPTNNIKFQISINELIYDTQISKSSLLRRLELLEKMKLIIKTKTKTDQNGNGKNEYRFNINQLEEIVSKLNGMKRKERIDYINQIFEIPQKDKNRKQVEPDNEVQEKIPITLTPAEIERENNIKANEALDKLQREESIRLMAEFQEREMGKINSKIKQNKVIGAIPTPKPITITKGKVKVAQNKNIEAERRGVSVDNTKEYKKDNVQLCLMNLFSNNKHCPFSEKFKNDKIYTKIMDNFGSKNYHTFVMNAFSENGFYTSSQEYLTKFCDKDRNILSEFIKMYIKNVNEMEMETENNTESVA